MGGQPIEPRELWNFLVVNLPFGDVEIVNMPDLWAEWVGLLWHRR